MKDLSDEYASVLTKKRTAYSEYRKARLDMQEYLKAKKNVEQFFNLVNQENMPEREQQKFREKLNILRWRSHPIFWNRAMESVIESQSSDGGSHDLCRGSQ